MTAPTDEPNHLTVSLEEQLEAAGWNLEAAWVDDEDNE